MLENSKSAERLRILILEDRPTDAELMEWELKTRKITFQADRVTTREAYEERLRTNPPDLILSDYQLPRFNGMGAIRLKRELAPRTPLIIVTSSIDETTAVECMKAGADDYVVKEEIERLAPAIENVLRKKKEREEKEQAWRAIEDSERKYRTLFETARDIIFTLSRNGEFTSLNPAFEVETKFKREDWIGKRFSLLLHPDDIIREEEFFQKELDGVDTPVHELRLRCADGNYITVEKIETPQIDGGKIVGVWGFARDISKRKLAEQRLREASQKLESANRELDRSNKELEQFAYMASHDLQEPLRMVASYSELLRRRNEKNLDASSKDFLKFIMDGVRRMQQLIQAILTYSKVGRGDRSFEVVESEAILGEVLSVLKFPIQESNAKITFGTLPPVYGNRIELILLFQNLISNALKYRADADPEIDIGAERVNEEWVFHVKDNGIGFDMQNSEKLFMLFQRLHSKHKYPGSGIGLGICKKIVEHHGGRIWAKSCEKEGATFFFALPAMTGQVSVA